MRETKHNQVRQHLLSHGHITSWEAIQIYGATRLSAIIFNLRKEGYDIETREELAKDRNGNTCRYANYIYRDNH